MGFICSFLSWLLFSSGIPLPGFLWDLLYQIGNSLCGA
jgi:hypothetical protein